MVTEKEKNVIYVGIKDPVEIRRSILESSKDSIQLLQRFEKFKEVRQEKFEAVEELKQIIKEVTKAISQLKSALPHTTLRFKEPEFEKEIEEKARIAVAEGKVGRSKMLADRAAAKSKKKGKSKGKGKKGKKTRASVVKSDVVVKKALPKAASQLEKLESELGDIESKLGKLI